MTIATSTAALLLQRKPVAIVGGRKVERVLNATTGQIEQRASTSSVVLDAAINEVHNTTATVTSHPVESGADITDHVHKEPDTIQIAGIISNTSTVFPRALPGVALANSILNEISGVTNDLAKSAYEQLKVFVDDRVLVTIETNLRTYENMLIENLSVTRDSTYGDALNFICTARELRIVNVDKISPAAPAPLDEKETPTKKSIGKQGTDTNQAVGDEVLQERSATKLKSISDAVGSGLSKFFGTGT